MLSFAPSVVRRPAGHAVARAAAGKRWRSTRRRVTFARTEQVDDAAARARLSPLADARRASITKLQHSDVFVYIEEVPRLPGALEGRLMMLPRAHEHRYVRIQIALRGSPEDTIALLGHELRHALEVAEAPSVQRPGRPRTSLRAHRR